MLLYEEMTEDRKIASLFAGACILAIWSGQIMAQDNRVEAPRVPPTPTTPVPQAAPQPTNPALREVTAPNTQPPPAPGQGFSSTPQMGPIPQTNGFATQGGLPGSPVNGPQMPTVIPKGMTSALPTNLPAGTTVSPERIDSHIMETVRPERVKVYPDDPESAWWEINPHFAFDRAQREQKPLLLLFTGIWNAQAMSLSQEVFSTRSFNEYVKENLVICYLSYEKNYTDTHEALRAIKEKFKVRGYPNIVIFNPNGEVERGIRGYRTGRPVDYFNELKSITSPVIESIKVQKAAKVREGYRDWSNYLGKEIFARFVQQDQTYVQLKDLSGTRWAFKINDLAPTDQKLVESFPPVAKIVLPTE